MGLCLEINILAFLPVISSEAGVAFENTMKYFVIQRCASIIFLFGVILCLFISNSFIFLKRSRPISWLIYFNFKKMLYLSFIFTFYSSKNFTQIINFYYIFYYFSYFL